MIRFSYNSFLILLLFVILFTGACTVQKRVHRKGWYVEWHWKQRKLERENKNIPNLEVGLRDTSTGLAQCSQPSLDKTDNTEQQELQRIKVIESVEMPKIRDTQPIENEAEIKSKEIQILLTEPVKSEKSSKTKPSQTTQPRSKSLSPTRVPTLAWVLLYIGIALVVLGIILGIMFFVANGSFIGAPLYIILALISGVLFLVFAAQTALAPMNSQPAPPDPRYEQEEPKREKKERKPLKKGDKIFIAVVAGILILIGIVVTTY